MGGVVVRYGECCRSVRGHPRSNGVNSYTDRRMEVKLGRWSRPQMLEGQLGSSKVKSGQILTDSRMKAKLGGGIVVQCRKC